MSKNAWAWTIGIVIFAAIAGFWAWRLPKTLGAIGGSDEALNPIFATLNDARKELGAQLANVSAKLDGNMKKIRDTVETQSARAAAVDKLKQELIDEAAKQKIKAALDAGQEKAADKKASTNH